MKPPARYPGLLLHFSVLLDMYRLLDENENTLIALRYDVHTLCVSGRITVACEPGYLSYIGNQPVFRNNKLHIIARNDDDNCGVPPVPGLVQPCTDTQTLYFGGSDADRTVLNAGAVVEYRCPDINGRPPAVWNPGTILMRPDGSSDVVQIGDDGRPGSGYTGLRDHKFSWYQRRSTRLYRIHLTYSNSIRRIVLRGDARFIVNSDSSSELLNRACMMFEAHNNGHLLSRSRVSTNPPPRREWWFGEIQVIASADAHLNLVDFCCENSRIGMSKHATVCSPIIRSSVYCEMMGWCSILLSTHQACLIQTRCSESASITVETVPFSDEFAHADYRLRQFRVLDAETARPLDLQRQSRDELGSNSAAFDDGMPRALESYSRDVNYRPLSTPMVFAQSRGSAMTLMDGRLLELASTSTLLGTSVATSTITPPAPVVRKRPNVTDPEVHDPDGGRCVVCDDENAVVLCVQCDTYCVCVSCFTKIVSNPRNEAPCPLCRGLWSRVDRLKPNGNHCVHGGCGEASVIVCRECYSRCVCIACCAKILDHEDPAMRRCPVSECSVSWELHPPVRPRRT